MPIEIYHLLEKLAKEHHRSKTQEAIVAITNGLSMYGHQIKKPIPFKWEKKISNKFIEEAIQEGRESITLIRVWQKSPTAKCQSEAFPSSLSYSK